DQPHVPHVRLLRAAALLIGDRHLALQTGFLVVLCGRRLRGGLGLFLLLGASGRDDRRECQRAGVHHVTHHESLSLVLSLVVVSPLGRTFKGLGAFPFFTGLPTSSAIWKPLNKLLNQICPLSGR